MAAYAKGMSRKQAIAAKRGETKTPKKRGLRPAKDKKVTGVPF